ncbi:MAG: hypothetical protein ACREUF_17110, partial [Solimonas sp.]
ADESPSAGDGLAPIKANLVAKASLEAWSGTRRLDDSGTASFPLLSLQAKATAGNSLSLKFDGLAAGRDEALGGRPPLAVIREAYLAYRQNALRLRVGEQIISWGRADLINPTDNLSARKYTWLASSDADQKVGPFSVSGEWSWGANAVQVVWQPFFRPDDIPLPKVPGFRYADHRPSTSLDAAAIRYDVSDSDLSWSVSYFQGPSKRPNLAAQPASLAQGRLDLDYPFMRAFGGDIERLVGKWVVRSEAAYSRVEGSGSDPLASRESFFLGVLGLERSFGQCSAFLQTIYRHTFDYIDPEQVPLPLQQAARGSATINDETRRNLFGLGSGLTYNTPDLRTSASVDVVYFADIDDWSLRPRLRYKLTDTVATEFGGDYFAGSDDGPLGRLQKNRLAFVRIEYALAGD